MEKWKDVVGYNGLYQISDQGRVKSIQKRGVCKTAKEHYLKPYISTTGYYKVKLYNGKRKKDVKIHRLVAMAFIRNPENKICVNHKDGNKLNNKASNLEWCTYKENTDHALKNGLKRMTFLSKRELINLYVTQHKGIRQIAREKHISDKRIKEYLKEYEIKRHIGTKYEIPIEELKNDFSKGIKNKILAEKYGCSSSLIARRKYQIKKGMI